jgi:5'-nucleotidase
MEKLSRRKFLTRSMSLGAGAMLLIYSDGSYKMTFAAAGPVDYSLRIIHNNDHHARIEPQPIDAVTLRAAQGSTTAVARLFGGVARRKTLFDQFRQEATSNSQNILFLDAGDVFQGTLFFNLYQGQADVDFYADLGYDALAIGNHEFDKGPQALVNFVKGKLNNDGSVAKANPIPMVAANITATETVLAPALTAGVAVPGSKIGAYTTLTRGGKKIGIFGLTTTETKVSSSPGAGIEFADPATVAQTTVNTLRNIENCDIVIGLTHIGYTEDKALAAAVNGIDIIVGGHSHTPLLPTDSTLLTAIGPVGIATQGPYATPVFDSVDPTQVKTAIVTDWEWAKWVGDVTVGFDVAGKISTIEGTIHPVWGDYVAPNTAPVLTGEQAPIAKNADFNTRIQPYATAVNALNAQKIGTINFTLDGGSSFRKVESTGGDFITDTMLERARAFTFPGTQYPLLVITNSGGIRASVPKGDITVGGVLTVLPFGNTLATVVLTGAQVWAALENGVSQVESNAGRFPQVAGIKFVWSRFGTPALQKDEVPNRPAQKGNRVLFVQVLNSSGVYTPIDLAAKYRVVTNNFMVTGGDGYFVFTKGGDKSDLTIGGGTEQFDTQLILADVVQDYIVAKTPVAAPSSGRIFAVQAALPLVAK